MLTIFTPVFNRAYIISRLYESLCRQTCKDFEWLIVDDGSTDNLEELISCFINDNIIKIRYIRQKNGGKHRAINRGVQEAYGEFFYIVDSDDNLTDDAVEWILHSVQIIQSKEDFAGVSGIRVKPDGMRIGGGVDFGYIDANALDIRFKYGVNGDLAEVFKTEVLKQYPFPDFEGERFCPEALVWNRIAEKYKLRYCHKAIYVCEYLQDGLTSNIIKVRRNSPRASMTFYSELSRRDIGLYQKYRAAVNFWRFAEVSISREYKMNPFIALAAFLPGRFFRNLDKNKIR